MKTVIIWDILDHCYKYDYTDISLHETFIHITNKLKEKELYLITMNIIRIEFMEMEEALCQN